MRKLPSLSFYQVVLPYGIFFNEMIEHEIRNYSSKNHAEHEIRNYSSKNRAEHEIRNYSSENRDELKSGFQFSHPLINEVLNLIKIVMRNEMINTKLETALPKIVIASL